MNSIIELRKKELSTQITHMMGIVKYFIDNKKRNGNDISISLYLENNQIIMDSIKNEFQRICDKFDPQSDNYEIFDNCIKQLSSLQNRIIDTQKRGERKLKNLHFLLPIKIMISIIFSWIYIWIWIVYWRWVDGWWYITLMGMIWYLPCGPFLLILYYIEEADKHLPTFRMFRGFFTNILLRE